MRIGIEPPTYRIPFGYVVPINWHPVLLPDRKPGLQHSIWEGYGDLIPMTAQRPKILYIEIWTVSLSLPDDGKVVEPEMARTARAVHLRTSGNGITPPHRRTDRNTTTLCVPGTRLTAEHQTFNEIEEESRQNMDRCRIPKTGDNCPSPVYRWVGFNWTAHCMPQLAAERERSYENRLVSRGIFRIVCALGNRCSCWLQ